MSKQWKIGIGVIVGILALCLAGTAGLSIGRVSTFAAMNRAGMGMQYPGGFNQPGQFEGRDRFNQNPQAGNPQLEVTLIDDDEDGIPDRGVVEMPAGPGFNRGGEGRFNDRGGPPQNFGREFNPGQRQFSRLPFLPVLPLGGLLCLTTLAGLAVLGVALYRRKPSPPASPSSPVTSPLENDAPEMPADKPVQKETGISTPEGVEPAVEISDETAASEDDEVEPDTSPQ